MLTKILESYKTTVGVRISVWKDGKATNSPVCVKVIDQEFAQEREISRLVETLGLPPVMVMVMDGSVHIGEERPDLDERIETARRLEDAYDRACQRALGRDAKSVGRQGFGEEDPF